MVKFFAEVMFGTACVVVLVGCAYFVSLMVIDVVETIIDVWRRR